MNFLSRNHGLSKAVAAGQIPITFIKLVIPIIMATQILPAAPISLETDTTMLRLDVVDDKVCSTYFGEKLRNVEDSASSAAAPWFYPTHWDAQTGPHGIAITQPDGQLSLDPVYVSHAITAPDADSQLLRIEMKDRRYPVELTLCVLAHKSSNVFERWVEITNKGDKPVVIDKAASASLHAKANKYFLTTFPGTWGAEATVRELEIAPGSNLSIRSGSTPKGAAEGSPAFLLSLDKPADETTGEVILGTLAWSGNWAFQFDNSATSNELDINAGYDNAYAAYTLDAGKTFTTPRFIPSAARTMVPVRHPAISTVGRVAAACAAATRSATSCSTRGKVRISPSMKTSCTG